MAAKRSVPADVVAPKRGSPIRRRVLESVTQERERALLVPCHVYRLELTTRPRFLLSAQGGLGQNAGGAVGNSRV